MLRFLHWIAYIYNHLNCLQYLYDMKGSGILLYNNVDIMVTLQLLNTPFEKYHKVYKEVSRISKSSEACNMCNIWANLSLPTFTGVGCCDFYYYDFFTPNCHWCRIMTCMMSVHWAIVQSSCRVNMSMHASRLWSSNLAFEERVTAYFVTHLSFSPNPLS